MTTINPFNPFVSGSDYLVERINTSDTLVLVGWADTSAISAMTERTGRDVHMLDADWANAET